MQIPCATLHEVINYLVENTEGVLTPLIIEEPYEKSICMCNQFFGHFLFHAMYRFSVVRLSLGLFLFFSSLQPLLEPIMKTERRAFK